MNFQRLLGRERLLTLLAPERRLQFTAFTRMRRLVVSEDIRLAAEHQVTYLALDAWR